MNQLFFNIYANRSYYLLGVVGIFRDGTTAPGDSNRLAQERAAEILHCNEDDIVAIESDHAMFLKFGI